eukprot:Phypoly_transcript_29174.p1 GENE.Phypoly_transcript_29174~~Phypoly_transcript_29174.p1  ORF type:complete len:114 (+),score=17.08 Phypoly_transcript_29174:69-410(+)
MDAYDFELFVKNPPSSRRVPAKQPEVKPINHCQRKYTKKSSKDKVSKHTKKIAKLIVEYNRKRPASYLEAVQKAGLSWEDIICVDSSGEDSPPKRSYAPSDKTAQEIDIETEE